MHNAHNSVLFDIRSLAKSLIDFWFSIYLLIWLCVGVLRALEVHIFFVNDWFTDLIFVPVTSHIALIVARIIHRGEVQIKFPLYYIIIVSLITAFIFEYLAPKYSNQYTADFFDALCYILGGLFYYYVHQTRIVQRKIIKNF